MGRLDGKIAAVTGGASGIGEATVRRLVAEGASVALRIGRATALLSLAQALVRTVGLAEQRALDLDWVRE